MARILLVRHAQSEWNALGRWQGWADPPLTVLGRSQAEQAALHLRAEGDNFGPLPSACGPVVPPPRVVISSDLQRASTTAGIVAALALPGVTPQTDPDWREYRVGAWSGMTRPEIEERWPGDLDRWDRGELLAPPDGEHRRHFEARLLRALDRAAAHAEEAAAHAEEAETSLVVTHGGAIRSLNRRFLVPTDHVGNLAGVLLEGSAGRFRPVGKVDLLSARKESQPAPD